MSGQQVKKPENPFPHNFNVEWRPKMGPRNIDIGGKGENNWDMTCPEYLLPWL